MNIVLGFVITAVVCLLGGAAGMFFWNRSRRIRGQEEAEVVVDNSVNNDEDRENTKKEIADRIKKNEEIREKLKAKLAEAEAKEAQG